ncbi:MAG: extracellular solute-binding protein family 1 [Paenibacillaceae bacterium]|nr:extracellular solute-binding protein family 1 [Paenibacillaceae bacterium]
MRLRKWGQLCFILPVVAMIALSGCGGGNNQSGSNPETQSGEADTQKIAPVSTEPVTIRMFQSSTNITDEQFNSFFVDPVKKKYPNITVEIVRGTNAKATEAVAAGDFPDMIFTGIGSIKFYKDLGLPIDLNPIIKKNKFNIDEFEPRIIDQFKVYSDNGELYAIPFLDNFSALWYNRDIFDQYGMTYPKDGMTWDDAIELARQMSSKSSGGVTQLCPGSFDQFTNVMSLPVVDAKTNKAVLETDNWKMLVDKFTTVHKIPGNTCGGATKESTDFVAGKVAMAGINGALLTQLEEASKQGPIINWDMASYPQFKEAPGFRRRMDVTLLMLSSTSKHPDQVFQVMQTVSQREEQIKRTRLGRMSAFKDPDLKKDFAADLQVAKGKNIQSIFKTKASAVPPYTPYNGPANKALNDAVNAVMGGENVNSALRAANEKANQDIEAIIQGGQ